MIIRTGLRQPYEALWYDWRQEGEAIAKIIHRMGCSPNRWRNKTELPKIRNDFKFP